MIFIAALLAIVALLQGRGVGPSRAATLVWHAAALGGAVAIVFLDYPEPSVLFFASYAAAYAIGGAGEGVVASQTLRQSAVLAAIAAAAVLAGTAASIFVLSHWLLPVAGSWLLFRTALRFFTPAPPAFSPRVLLFFAGDALAATIAVAPLGAALLPDSAYVALGVAFGIGALLASPRAIARPSRLAFGWLVALRLFVFGLVPFTNSLLLCAAVVAIGVAALAPGRPSEDFGVQ